MSFQISSYSEYNNHIKKGSADWTDNTINGKCTGCGECCSNLLALSKSEIKNIKKYILEHNITEDKIALPTVNPIVDMTCPFLIKNKNTNKKCKIYEIRPMICKCYKCDDPYGAAKHSELFAEKRNIVNVRETFGRELNANSKNHL